MNILQHFKFSISCFFLAAALSTAPPAFAQGVLGQPEEDEWRTTAFLYLWGTSLDGTARLGGNEVDLDASFSDLFENLDSAFSGRIESHKDDWGVFLDFMSVKLDASAMLPNGASLNTTTKNRISEIGGSYRFTPTLEGLFGGRFQYLKLELGFPNGEVPNRSVDWGDGFIGLRFVPVQTENWSLWLRGDVGVFGDSEQTWNTVLGAAYTFDNNWSLALAYRYLSNDYEEGAFAWDVDHSGLGLAVGYTW